MTLRILVAATAATIVSPAQAQNCDRMISGATPGGVFQVKDGDPDPYGLNALVQRAKSNASAKKLLAQILERERAALDKMERALAGYIPCQQQRPLYAINPATRALARQYYEEDRQAILRARRILDQAGTTAGLPAASSSSRASTAQPSGPKRSSVVNPAHSNKSATPNAPDGRQQEDRDISSQNHCIDIERNSNSLADFLINKCSYRVNVTFWDDTEQPGASWIGPNSRQSISKQRGDVHVVVCRHPALPRRTGSSTGRCS